MQINKNSSPLKTKMIVTLKAEEQSHLQVNCAALERYEWIINRVHSFGMKVTLTFFHHSLPPWAAEYGCWKMEKTVDYFMDFTSCVILLAIAEETLAEFLSKASRTAVDWVQMIEMKDYFFVVVSLHVLRNADLIIEYLDSFDLMARTLGRCKVVETKTGVVPNFDFEWRYFVITSV
ncbi:hypothetical protein EZV62_009080 [Acer yangbiense]|uniref:Uncharacterized protein n=1 Tax=Acer yangbiense TaxID=1000413 RepID=A0A5C7IFL2_9ROSI|nr:hypothetical protein EZV62_009080 [Acer yangbiense]